MPNPQTLPTTLLTIPNDHPCHEEGPRLDRNDP
jgi:hypothetical protein